MTPKLPKILGGSFAGVVLEAPQTSKVRGGAAQGGAAESARGSTAAATGQPAQQTNDETNDQTRQCTIAALTAKGSAAAALPERVDCREVGDRRLFDRIGRLRHRSHLTARVRVHLCVCVHACVRACACVRVCVCARC